MRERSHKHNHIIDAHKYTHTDILTDIYVLCVSLFVEIPPFRARANLDPRVRPPQTPVRTPLGYIVEAANASVQEPGALGGRQSKMAKSLAPGPSLANDILMPRLINDSPSRRSFLIKRKHQGFVHIKNLPAPPPPLRPGRLAN